MNKTKKKISLNEAVSKLVRNKTIIIIVKYKIKKKNNNKYIYIYR